MNERKLERQILYIVVFVLITVLLVLSFGMTINYSGLGHACLEFFSRWTKEVDWLQTTTTIGTLLAAIASWRAASAAKTSADTSLLQRSDQIKPDIYISNNTVQVEFDSGLEYYRAKGFGDLKDKSKWPIYLEISNAGRGHAKDIEVMWEFAIEKVVKELKDEKNPQPQIFFEKSGILVIPESGGGSWERESKQTINVLFLGDKNYISIPFSYVSVLLYKIHLEMEEKDLFKVQPMKIELGIKYMSIDGESYEKTFIVAPYISNGTISTSKSEGLITYTFDLAFDVKEINSKKN